MLKALVYVYSLRKNAIGSWGSNLCKHSYEAGDRVWTGHRAKPTYRLRWTYPSWPKLPRVTRATRHW